MGQNGGVEVGSSAFWGGHKFLLVGSLWDRCSRTQHYQDGHLSSIFGGTLQSTFSEFGGIFLNGPEFRGVIDDFKDALVVINAPRNIEN